MMLNRTGSAANATRPAVSICCFDAILNRCFGAGMILCFKMLFWRDHGSLDDRHVVEEDGVE